MKNIALSADTAGSAVASIIGFLIGIAILIILFLVLRQVILWYWKVDSIETQLKAQTEILKQIRDGKTGKPE